MFEVARPVGTNNAVFGGSAGVDVQLIAGAGGEVVRIAAARTKHTRTSGVSARRTRAFIPGRPIVVVGVDVRINLDEAAQLDAGVGAGDVVETGAVKGADLHVLNGFRLDGKIGCLCPGGRCDNRSRTQDKALNLAHKTSKFCSVGKVPVRRCKSHLGVVPLIPANRSAASRFRTLPLNASDLSETT